MTEPVIDNIALGQYRERLIQLDSEIAEAEDWNDPARLELLQVEQQTLLDTLTTDIGLAGRIRNMPSDHERARVSVTKAITVPSRPSARHHPTWPSTCRPMFAPAPTAPIGRRRKP